MAICSKLVNVGMPPREAEAIGAIPDEVTAAGTVQADAAAITNTFVLVNGADNVKGVRMPTYDMSKSGVHHIVNNEAAATLILYPATGEKLNLNSANTAVKILGGYHCIVYYCNFPTSGKSWMCLQGVAAVP